MRRLRQTVQFLCLCVPALAWQDVRSLTAQFDLTQIAGSWTYLAILRLIMSYTVEATGPLKDDKKSLGVSPLCASSGVA